MRGFALGEQSAGYKLLTRDYGHFHNPVSALWDLHPSGEARPSHDHVVDVACCRGCVWKHEEESRLAQVRQGQHRSIDTLRTFRSVLDQHKAALGCCVTVGSTSAVRRGFLPFRQGFTVAATRTDSSTPGLLARTPRIAHPSYRRWPTHSQADRWRESYCSRRVLSNPPAACQPATLFLGRWAAGPINRHCSAPF